MNLQLAGKLALVTGSSAGIGLAIASALAGEGAAVVVNGRSKDRVAAGVEQIRCQHPDALLREFVGDLSKPDVTQHICSTFPDVNILINNLGYYAPKAVDQLTDQDWTSIIETNFMSGMRLSRYYLPLMKTKNWGRIIFISSESAVNIPVEMIHYGVTKIMQLALARGLAETTVGTAVTVNSILAGPTRSEGVRRFMEDLGTSKGVTPLEIEAQFFKFGRPTSLLQRFAGTEEVAPMVAFIASPLSSATNGAALRVEGGVLNSVL